MDRAKFYHGIRNTLYKGLPNTAVTTLEAILDAIENRKISIDHVAYMMATAYHEVGPNLIPIRENLNYSTASRIKQVWPSRFKSLAAAQPYVNNPKQLANKVYNGRYGNAENGDDGWNYRGGGLPQTTFKDNYAKVGQIIGYDLVKQPELILEPRVAVAALVEGSLQGIYTGKKLSDFKTGDYYNMRDVINADKKLNGKKIADHAKVFEKALHDAGYGEKPIAACTV